MTVGDGNLEVQNIRKEGQTTWTPMMPKGNHPFFQVKTAMARGPHAATPPLPPRPLFFVSRATRYL